MQNAIYVFYGNDSYIIKSKTNQLLKKHDIDEFNIAYYDIEETEIEEAINDASTMPFMADKKAVILKSCYLLTSDKPSKEPAQNIDAVLRYINQPSSDTLLIIQVPYPALDERKALTKAIKRVATIEQCEPMGEVDASSWIRRQLGKKNIKIDKDALEEFLKRIEGKTEVLVSEMTKLLLYAEDLDHIDLKTIQSIITKNVEDNVYEITNQLLIRNQEKALEIYRDLVMHSEDPLRILGILVNKYREIFHVKQLLAEGKKQPDIQEYFNASRGRAYYMLKNANAVDLDTVKKHLKHLETLDFQIKTGQIDKNLGIELFILGV
jgi:DNA polymerase-3 subunit delta